MRSMVHKRSLGPLLAILLLSGIGAVVAQTPAHGVSDKGQFAGNQASRLAGDWRSSPSVAIPASKPPASWPNLGAAAAGARLERMLLLLDPAADRQQTLLTELQSQQNPASPEFHRWLTPAGFAAAYANSSTDVAAVSAWLRSQGFQVAPLPAGLGWIEFSGTVGQVEQAFQTQVQSVAAPSGTRLVLASGIAVPAALKPLIHGLVSLDGAVSAAALTTPKPVSASSAELAAETSLAHAEALSPHLMAQLLHLDALQAAGIDGAGETLAIAARSNVNSGDVAAFRAAFGLPANPLSVIPNGSDPGLTGDQAEATLAASWAGAAAPGAQIVLVPAATTGATDGVDLSLAAIVDQALAHTVAVGYSSCEAALSEAHQAFYAALYRQAAAEGIAVVAASGDSGPSACHLAGSEARVASGYGVNALASTPWNTAVGVAALSATGSALAAWSPVSGADPAYAGGGGSSALYAAAGWQPLPPKAAAPAGSGFVSGQRLLPDLALPTALDSGANRGLAFCLTSSTDSSPCTLVRSGGSTAAASVFAGIAALIAEKNGAQGNLASNLYALSRFGGVFNDVQEGSAQLPCATASPDCGATGLIGYTAASGYDLATGLGSVNAQALVNDWAKPMNTGTTADTVVITSAPNAPINPSLLINIIATVSGQSGPPTGTVLFYDSTTGVDLVSNPSPVESNGTAELSTGGVFGLGDNEIEAVYSGDATYEANTSAPVDVVTALGPTSLTLLASNTSPSAGATITVTATLATTNPGNTPPSGTVTLNVDGVPGTKLPLNITTAVFTVIVPARGTHTLQVVYSGDANYAASASAVTTITVAKVATSLLVTPATTTPLGGSSLQITATLTALAASASQPTGSVTFTLDNATIGSSGLTGGTTASITVTAPTSGTHSLVATYSGDGNFSTSTSPAVTLTVSKIATSTSVTPSTTTPAAGASMQVSATVTPAASGSSAPSGAVTFTLDGVTAGTATLNSNSTTVTTNITAPSAGSHILQASYSGDTIYSSSDSSQVTLTVAKSATTLTVTPPTTTPNAGTSFQVTATIGATSSNSVAPTGTVAFYLDNNSPVSVNVSGTTANGTLIASTAGSHTLYAVYSGDNNYSGSTSSTVTFTVGKSATTLTLNPSTTTPLGGSSMQVTATLSTTYTGGAAPTGTVTFTMNGQTVGTPSLSNGSTATVTITVPAAGTLTLQASYSGDSNYGYSQSQPLTITVAKATTTTVVTTSATPALGVALPVTATVTATTVGSTQPTGIVTFTMDGSTVGAVAVSGYPATASMTLPALTAGTHTLTAAYSGDNYYSSSTGNLPTFTVAKTITTTVVTPSTTTPALGATLPVTATVTAAALGSTQPTGTVTFALDGATVAAIAVSGYPATVNATLAAMTPGTHTLTATYSGDNYYATSTATAPTITVAKSPTTMIVTPATTSPAGGSSLLVTATITATSPGSTVPTGTVAFTLDGATAGTQAVVAGYPSTATITLPSMTPGTHVLAGVYSGDTYYGTSTAPSVTLTVSKGATTTVLTPSTIAPTAGSSMSVTVTITSPNAGATQPSGSVNITEDGTSVATGTVVPGAPSTAVVTIPLVSAGSHLLQATYSGDTYYTGSTSAIVPIVAAKGISVTTLTATPATLTAGVNETLTATIAPLNPVTGTVYTMTGTVSFYDGGTTLLGTANVAANTATLTGVKLANNISHTITAIYSGDLNWLGSSSSVLPLAATTLPDYVVLTSNFTTVQPGVALVLTATVTPASTPATGAEANPTGQVVFYNGTTILGRVSLVPVVLSDASTATLTIQTLPGGLDTVYATYLGDLYYDVATSNLLTLTVEDFTITPSPSNPATNLNIVKGGAGSADFIVTGLGGFDNEVQLVCAVPSQDDMTCTASPQQVVPTATVTFVVQTFTTGAIAANRKPESLWPHAAGGTALAVLAFFLLPFGRRARVFTGRGAQRFLVLLLLLVGLAGVGIGCTNVTPLNASGTPLGVATLKITGSAYVDNTVVSKSVYLTVNVQPAP